MNKKGFTLVELLAVVAVLGMIIGFATYSVTSLLKKAQDKTRNETINNLKDAAKMYCIDNHFKKKVTTPCTVTVNDLINSGDFTDKDGVCSETQELKNKKITVTIKVIDSTSGSKDYEATVESGTCKKN